MSEMALPTTTDDNAPSLARAWLRALCVVVPCGLWTTFTWFSPARRWPIVGTARAALRDVWNSMGLTSSIGWMLQGLLFTVVGFALVRLIVGRPFMLHETRLPKDMQRLMWLSLAIAFPVQVALGLAPSMQKYYANFFVDGGGQRIFANAVTIFTEHLWIEGVVLGLALPPDVFSRPQLGPRIGRLSKVGLGFVAGAPRTLSTWLGVPRDVWPALVVQGVLFFVLHFRKDFYEVLSSLPGGIAVGWLSFRARSFLPAMALHLATGAVVITTIWLCR